MRGVAHRAADVAAGVDAGESGRERRRRPAGRAAGRSRQIPWVVGGAVDRVVALVVGEQQRHVGLAEQHGPGVLQPIDRERVGRRHVVLELRIAPRGRRARHVVALLDGHGHAVERPPYFATRERSIRRLRACARPFRIKPYDGIEPRIVLCDAGEKMLQNLERADLAFTNEPGDLGGRFEMRFHGNSYVFTGVSKTTEAAPVPLRQCPWAKLNAANRSRAARRRRCRGRSSSTCKTAAASASNVVRLVARNDRGFNLRLYLPVHLPLNHRRRESTCSSDRYHTPHHQYP